MIFTPLKAKVAQYVRKMRQMSPSGVAGSIINLFGALKPNPTTILVALYDASFGTNSHLRLVQQS